MNSWLWAACCEQKNTQSESSEIDTVNCKYHTKSNKLRAATSELKWNVHKSTEKGEKLYAVYKFVYEKKAGYLITCQILLWLFAKQVTVTNLAQFGVLVDLKQSE